MRYKAPLVCPVCGKAMEVTSLHCTHCDSVLSGHFEPCRFCALQEKDLRFLETFLRCRGSIKDVERAMGLSYPTVRNMLDTTLKALGLDDGAAPAADTQRGAERKAILDQLERGEIDAAEAARQLKSIRREQP